jgi:hypothetical protein
MVFDEGSEGFWISKMFVAHHGSFFEEQDCEFTLAK